MVRYLLYLLLLIAATSPSYAKRYSEAELKAMFTVSPFPEYPYELRKRRITGSGVFRMYVGRDGRVTSAKTLLSTGQPGLDAAALSAFKRWRATPGPRREVDVPATFTMQFPRKGEI